MSRNTLLSLASCLLAASVCLGEIKKVVLKDGRVLKGEVERTKEGIKVKVKLGVLFFANDKIASVEDVRDAQSEYASRLAKIDKTSPDAHVQLGQWAMERRLYKQAVQQFKAALAIKKGHERASLLLRQAEAKLRAPVKVPDSTKPKPSTGATVPRAPGKLPFQTKLMIQEDDIYRIRLEELRKDERIAVEFRNDVVNRFIEQMRGVGDFRKKGFVRKFRSLPRASQARYILDNVDRDDSLKDDILVKNDPMFMREFRGRTWRIVSSSCASSKCHGAKEGKGKLKLFNFVGRNDRVDYTNFLILDSYHVKGTARMIDRDAPERSLLLQYGLPKNQAESRHPKEIREPFSSRKTAAYQQVLKWIKELSGPMHPDYRIKQRPPNVMAQQSGIEGVREPKSRTRTKPKKKVDIPF